MTLLEISGLLLSLPSVKQLKAGDFDLDMLVERFTQALVDEPRRNEIHGLTGDAAVLVVECLDKVSEVNDPFLEPGPYHALGHLI